MQQKFKPEVIMEIIQTLLSTHPIKAEFIKR